MTAKDFEDRNREYMSFLDNATAGIKDPTARARAENTSMRAKILELYAQIENLENMSERLRTEIATNVKGGDLRKATNQNAPAREANDSIDMIAQFRDGSKIERRRRNGIAHWWFSTPSAYIRVRSHGDDPYGVYVIEQRRPQLEAALVDQSKKLDRGDMPLCVVAYQVVTGKKLY